MNYDINKKPKNHKKYRQSVVMRAMKKALVDKVKDDQLESIINNTGITGAFALRKDIIHLDIALKQSVTETLNEIRLTKARMKEMFVYPSEVENGKKTIREFCTYVDERTHLAELRAILHMVEVTRVSLGNFLLKSNMLWWTRPKEKTTVNQ